MATPHSSIPGYRPGPILSGPKKAFVASIFVLPVGAYVYMRWQQMQGERARLLIEDEGRKNWDDTNARDRVNLGVDVGRSGGGI